MENLECSVSGLRPAIYACATLVLGPFIENVVGKNLGVKTITGFALCAMAAKGMEECLNNPSGIATVDNIGLLYMNFMFGYIGVQDIRNSGDPVKAYPYFADAVEMPQPKEVAGVIPEATELTHS